MKKSRKCLALMCMILSILVFAVPLQSQAAKAQINKRCLIICVGKKEKLKVSGTTKKVTWSSSNKKVVKVSKSGTIRGVKKGTATITAKVGKQKLKCKVKVKDAVKKISGTVTVRNSATVYLNYFSDRISCKSSNPAVAYVKLNDCGPAEEGPGMEADLVIYGRKNGTATITITNNCNKKKMKFKVKVRNPKAVTEHDKLEQYIISKGNTDTDANRYISKCWDSGKSSAKIAYDYWEKNVEYEYNEKTASEQVKWYILGANDPADRYIVMWITPKGASESQYVTAKHSVTGYKGEKLVFNEAWFGTPADQELQEIANRVTKNAIRRLNEVLKTSVNASLADVLE